MHNTRRPIPALKDRGRFAKTRHHALHEPSKRMRKLARMYWKRYSHNWSEHFTERNQARRANKQAMVA